MEMWNFLVDMGWKEDFEEGMYWIILMEFRLGIGFFFGVLNL